MVDACQRIESYVSAARREVNAALDETGCDPRAAEVARKLHALLFLCTAACMMAGEVTDAARVYDVGKTSPRAAEDGPAHEG